MDVVVVGKSEHGGKNELEIRRHRRRRRRRNAKLTKVGRFARRKRERKKSVTRYEPTGRGKSCKREEKKVYIHISIEWHWVNRCSPKKVASNMSIGALSSTSWGVTFLPRLETVFFWYLAKRKPRATYIAHGLITEHECHLRYSHIDLYLFVSIIL